MSDDDWDERRPIAPIPLVVVATDESTTLGGAIDAVLGKHDPDARTFLYWKDRQAGGPTCLMRFAPLEGARDELGQFHNRLELWAVRIDGSLYRASVRYPGQTRIADLGRAAGAGYIDRDPYEIVLSYHPGGYGGGEIVPDFVAFLESVGINVVYNAISTALLAAASVGGRRLLRWRRRRQSDAAAIVNMKAWEESDIAQPEVLRSWLEVKPTWSVEEVATRLQCTGPASERLLLAVGYERIAGSADWARSTSSAATRRRKRWLRMERTPGHRQP
ncbi:hypothetical protein [Amnibacterium soli]